MSESRNLPQAFARWFRARSTLAKVALVFGFLVIVGAISLAAPDRRPTGPVGGPAIVGTGTGLPTGGSSPSAGSTSSGSPSPQVSQTAEPARFIAGLTVERVTRRFARRGYRCDGPRSTFTEFEWTCSHVEPTVRYEVRVAGADPSRVRTVSSAVRYDQGTAPRPDRAVAFLKLVAGVRYDGAKPKSAARWTQDNAEAGGTTVIGAARFDLRRADAGRTWTLDLTGVTLRR